MTLPSFKVGKPIMPITSNTYPTNFGDLADPQGNTYSRVNLSVPVTRHMAMSVKTFVPIVLIVICAAFVFFVRPHYAEGRIGLDITALLTGRVAAHFERHAARRRLPDDPRQDLSPRLRVHHRRLGASSTDVMARCR
jgi:hypothetical protein